MRRRMSLPPVVILCGGRGTRLQERTIELPKPLVEIGGRPILWHVMQLYLRQGARRFLLCTGYKGELIDAFAAEQDWPSGVRVECVDTGLDTPTGGRIHRIRERLNGANWLKVLGEAPGKGAILSFTVEGAHAHDVAQILDRYGVAVRAGTHCAEPLMRRFGVTSSARASFALYNTEEEADAFVDALTRTQAFFA